MKAFLEKIETQFDELIAAAEPDLRHLYRTDRGAYLALLHSVRHQLEQLIIKARDTMIKAYEENGEHKYNDKDYEYVEHFINGLDSRQRAFFNKIEVDDIDQMYQDLLAEFETVKNTLKCTQCGSLLNIDKMYFLPTYVDCPSCNTQNTFNPSQAMYDFAHHVQTQPILNPDCVDAYKKYAAIVGEAQPSVDAEPSVEVETKTATGESDSIHGISFYDYVAASKMMSTGTPVEEVIKIFGVEVPVWTEVAVMWGQRMMQGTLGNLFMEYWEKADSHPKFAEKAAGGQDSPGVVKLLNDPYLLYEANNAQLAVVNYGLDYGEFLLKTFGVTESDVNAAYIRFTDTHKHDADLLSELDRYGWKKKEEYEAKFAAEQGGNIADEIEL